LRDDRLRFAAVVLGVVIVDQVTKAWIAASLSLHQAVSVIPGFFSIVHVQNPGGAFGWMSGEYSHIKRFFFTAGTLVAAGLLLQLFRRLPREYRLLHFGIALILGGAVGNLIDRIRSGSVLDFLDFYWRDLHWPAFNVADSAVTIGAGILIYYLVFRKIPV